MFHILDMKQAGLRKYFISKYVMLLSFPFYMFQILDMKDSELKMLADHMGYSLNIHTEIYWMQTSLQERAKVGSVLTVVENGNINRFKAREMGEISVDG